MGAGREVFTTGQVRRIQSSPDGPGRDDLHTEGSELRPLPGQQSLSGFCAGSSGVSGLSSWPRKKVPLLTVTAAVIRGNGRVLLAQRPEGGLLGGLWEFPGGTLEADDAGLEACLKREIQEELNVDIDVLTAFGVYKHAYTHFKIILHAFICDLVGHQEPKPVACSDLNWVRLDELERYPMGKVDRRIARRLVKEGLDGTRAN